MLLCPQVVRSRFYILFIIFFPIWTIHMFSIESRYSYLNISSILPPIISPPNDFLRSEWAELRWGLKDGARRSIAKKLKRFAPASSKARNDRLNILRRGPSEYTT